MSLFTSDVTIEPGTNPVGVTDNGGSLTVDGSVTVTQTTGTNLHTVTDTGSTTAVTGNVTVVQPTGTNLHVVVDGTVATTSGGGTTATITQVTVTNAVSITLLAANANRKKAIIYMPTIGTKLYIGFTATTSLTNFTYIVNANNTTLEVTNYTGVISAIATGASDLVNITEIV